MLKRVRLFCFILCFLFTYIQPAIANSLPYLGATGTWNTTSCPYANHWIQYVMPSNILKLEDGSEWLFDPSFAGIVHRWNSNEVITLSPNSSWGSSYAYILKHKISGYEIPVNPVLGPAIHGPYTLWIIGINRQLREIYLTSGLNDRTVWHIPETDRYLFDEWQIDDTIMVGENTSWWWWLSPYNFILINVNLNHYVRAKCASYY